MLDPNWSNLLTQVPLVGVFILYSLYITKAFMDALDRRDIAFEKRNAAVIEAIQDMNNSICSRLDQAKRSNTTRTKKTQG